MILDEIVAKTKVRLEENKKKLPPEELQKQALSMAADTGFPLSVRSRRHPRPKG